MATDPRAVKFLSEDARVMGERIKALQEDMQRVSDRWFGEIQSLVPDDAEIIEDGRASQGVSRIANTELISAMSKMQQVLDLLNTSGQLDELNKMRVRTLED